MKLVHDDAVRKRPQSLGSTLDFGNAGQKSEDTTVLVAESSPDRRRHGILDPQFGRSAEIAKLQRMGAAFALDHRRIVHQFGITGAVEGRGHRHQSQIRPQRGLCVESKRQAEVAVEAPLMYLIEQHGGDAGEFRIGLDAVDEDAFGENGHARGCGALRVHARSIAERAPDRFAGQLGHALGRSARSNAAGGQQQHFVGAPGLIEQRRRDRRRLARPRRRHHDRIAAIAQRGEQVREHGVDGKIGHWP